MAIPAKRVLLFIVVGLSLLAAIPVGRLWAYRYDYAEAEPLQPMIWALADEMKQFAKETGRPPKNLYEVIHFAPERDFSALWRYPHEFTTNGPLRFSVRMNRRFGFTIDDQYTPAWVFPKGPWWADPGA